MRNFKYSYFCFLYNAAAFGIAFSCFSIWSLKAWKITQFSLLSYERWQHSLATVKHLDEHKIKPVHFKIEPVHGRTTNWRTVPPHQSTWHHPGMNWRGTLGRLHSQLGQGPLSSAIPLSQSHHKIAFQPSNPATSPLMSIEGQCHTRTPDEVHSVKTIRQNEMSRVHVTMCSQ